MLGQATARLQGGPRHLVLRLWGVPEIHTRQKWAVVWPVLERLPREGVRLLDAGCGPGDWSLEIASRRPGWEIEGVDLNEPSIESAEAGRSRLGLANVRFVCRDFLEYRPEAPFDALLSVASAHYLVESGRGSELFDRFRSWLKPGGLLVLYGPRCGREVPFARSLPGQALRAIFSDEDLRSHCDRGGFRVESLTPQIGRIGVMAKRVAWWCDGRPAVSRLLTYPLVWSMNALDGRVRRGRAESSIAWLLTARAGA